MSRTFTSEHDRRDKKTGKFIPHRACVEAIKQEQTKLINFFQKERAAISAKKSEVRDMDTAFRARSTRFRAVFDAAWDVIIERQPTGFSRVITQDNINALRIALEKADHLWEGFGGVIPDPNPSAEKWRHGNKTRIRNHSRFPNFTDPHE